MDTGSTSTALIVGLAVLVVVGVSVGLRFGRKRNDWGGERPPVTEPERDEAPYGHGSPTYPASPAPPTPPSLSESVEHTGEQVPHAGEEVSAPSVPTDPQEPSGPSGSPTIDDSLRFREQNRPDEPEKD